MTAYEFVADLYLWEARRDDLWTFVSLPPDLSEEVTERAKALPRAGFGAVKVEVTVGRTTWRTSIFPQAEDHYVLPVKRTVREAEHLLVGRPVRVGLELVHL